MAPVPENLSDLRLGVLTIFAEAQAWARERLDDAMVDGSRTSAHIKRGQAVSAAARAAKYRRNKKLRKAA